MDPSIPFYYPAAAIQLRQFIVDADYYVLVQQFGAAAAVCSGSHVQGPSLKHQVYVQAAKSHMMFQVSCSSFNYHVQASSIKF